MTSETTSPITYGTCGHTVAVSDAFLAGRPWYGRHARKLTCPRCHRAATAVPAAAAQVSPEDFLLEAAAVLRSIRNAKPALAEAARTVWSKLVRLAEDASWLAEWAAVTLAQLPTVVAQHAAVA